MAASGNWSQHPANMLSTRTKMAVSGQYFEPQEIDHSIRTPIWASGQQSEHQDKNGSNRDPLDQHWQLETAIYLEGDQPSVGAPSWKVFWHRHRFVNVTHSNEKYQKQQDLLKIDRTGRLLCPPPNFPNPMYWGILWAVHRIQDKSTMADAEKDVRPTMEHARKDLRV